MNARLQRQLPGEDCYVGEHIFGNPQANLETGSNRELLLEFCASQELAVVNTFFQRPVDELVTYRRPGTPPLQTVDAQCFAQLDFVLASPANMHLFRDIRSDRTAALASHHFLLVASMLCQPMVSGVCNGEQIDRGHLKDKQVAESFNTRFERYLGSRQSFRSNEDVNAVECIVAEAFTDAAQVLTSHVAAHAKRPWISGDTLKLIERRLQARMANDWQQERQIHKLVRASAKKDKRQYLTDLAGTGSWINLRKLRKPALHSQGRLRGTDGELVSSDARAETFAQYLENVQWAVRPAVLCSDPPLHAELPVQQGKVTFEELKDAVRALRPGKAVGLDGHPMEYWRAVLSRPGAETSLGAGWLLELCNRAWMACAIPQSWQLQRVALFYKKGDPADCGNYRPIC